MSTLQQLRSRLGGRGFGLPKASLGGKPDDITCVLARVCVKESGATLAAGGA